MLEVLLSVKHSPLHSVLLSGMCLRMHLERGRLSDHMDHVHHRLHTKSIKKNV